MPTVPPAQQAADSAKQETTLAALVLILLSDDDAEQVAPAIQALLAEHGIRPEASLAAAEMILPHAYRPTEQRATPQTALHHVTRTGVARQAAQLMASASRISLELDQAAGAPPSPPTVPPSSAAAAPEPGPAGRHVAAGADERRAAFGQASRDRIAQAVQHPGEQFPVATSTLDTALERERRFFAQHLNAERTRQDAARRVDATAARLGVTRLGWRARLDGRTTPACAAAHGNNFDVARPPALGYPGTPHGGTCRCKPGPPFPGQPLIDELVLPAE